MFLVVHPSLGSGKSPLGCFIHEIRGGRKLCEGCGEVVESAKRKERGLSLRVEQQGGGRTGKDRGGLIFCQARARAMSRDWRRQEWSETCVSWPGGRASWKALRRPCTCPARGHALHRASSTLRAREENTEGTRQGETPKLRGREHNMRSGRWSGQTSSASWQCGLTRKSSGAAEMVACTSSSICVHPVHPR